MSVQNPSYRWLTIINGCAEIGKKIVLHGPIGDLITEFDGSLRRSNTRKIILVDIDAGGDTIQSVRIVQLDLGPARQFILWTEFVANDPQITVVTISRNFDEHIRVNVLAVIDECV